MIIKRWAPRRLRRSLRRRGAAGVSALLFLLVTVAGATAAHARPADLTVDNAAWSWWIQPLAVQDGDDLYAGSVARGGTVRVHHVDTGSGAVREVRLGTVEPDDHNAPAVLHQPARRRVLTAWTGHGQGSTTWLRAVDTASWTAGPTTTVRWSESDPASYAQLLTDGGNRVVLLARVKPGWRYVVSENGGDTWSAPRTLLYIPAEDEDKDKQVYVLTKPKGTGTYRLAAYGHPVTADHRQTHYAEIDVRSMAVSTSTGRTIGTLAGSTGPQFQWGDLEVAVDPTPGTGWTTRLLDVGSVSGFPAIAYAVWDASTSGKATYKIKIMRDGAWSTIPWEVDAGEPFGHNHAARYLGGMVFGPAGTMILAREKSGEWWSEQYSVTPDGARLVETVASPAARVVARPYVPYGTGSTMVLLQKFVGPYASYRSFDIDTLIYRR